jgi:hypothetical protein
MCHLQAMKASTSHDPESPRLHEAMQGEHREHFLVAVGEEFEELEHHGMWTVVKMTSLPRGVNLLPSTWALKIKRHPDGHMPKPNARFCCQGDKQTAGVDCFESCASVVSWSAVWMVIDIAVQQGWSTRQVNFSNAFAVQAAPEEDSCIETPAMLAEKTHTGKESVVLMLNKLLCGLVQAPRSWCQHVQKDLDKLNFKPLPVTQLCTAEGACSSLLTWTTRCSLDPTSRKSKRQCLNWNRAGILSLVKKATKPTCSPSWASASLRIQQQTQSL